MGAVRHWHRHENHNSWRKSNGLQPLAPGSVTHVHWHSYLNRILTRDPAWQTNVGGGVFTRDHGTPRLAVENIRLLLYHCNAMPLPEDHFFTIARSRRPFANREKHDRPI